MYNQGHYTIRYILSHCNTKIKWFNLQNFQKIIITVCMIFQAESCKIKFDLLIYWSVYDPLTLHRMCIIVRPSWRMDNSRRCKIVSATNCNGITFVECQDINVQNVVWCLYFALPMRFVLIFFVKFIYLEIPSLESNVL